MKRTQASLFVSVYRSSMLSPTRRAADKIGRLRELCEEALVGVLLVEPVEDGLLPVVVLT